MTERPRYVAAWKNARNRAQGYAQRYHYEQKLCRDADIRATKAIRAQLRAESQLDEAAAESKQLRATLNDVLRTFVHHTHPGEPCIQSHHVPVARVEAWRAILKPEEQTDA